MRSFVAVMCAALAMGGITLTATQFLSVAHAQTATTTSALQNQVSANSQEILQLNQEIAKYEAELQQVGSDKKTLQSAINALNLKRREMEAQIALTERKINTTQIQIRQLGVGIAGTEQSIEASRAALAEDIRRLQQDDNEPLILLLLSSGTLTQAWDDSNALLELQGSIEDRVQTLRGQETMLADSQTASKQKQNLLMSQKQSLTSKQQSLTETKQSKLQLLAETNAQESKYQQLLSAAEAQLTSFSAFAQNAGGSGLLANQTSCDSWGCYYNQRDAAWGNDQLDGTQYLLKSDGCLVTVMAMVMTHYGYRDVTPVSINSNPGNFAAYYPAYLLFTIHVDGVAATRKASLIDATLAAGTPVVIGLHAYGGTHFVVFISGSRGNYVMRDPYIPNGKDISFTAHYSMKNIYSIAKVEIQ